LTKYNGIRALAGLLMEISLIFEEGTMIPVAMFVSKVCPAPSLTRIDGIH
jgi:hypothetical protein